MNCTLDDTRHSREGSLVRIMERTLPTANASTSDNDGKSIRSMLDMTLRKGANDMFGKDARFIFLTTYILNKKFDSIRNSVFRVA